MDDIFLILIGLAVLVVLLAIAFRAYRITRGREESKTNTNPAAEIIKEPVSFENQFIQDKEEGNTTITSNQDVPEEPPVSVSAKTTDRQQVTQRTFPDLDLTNGSLSIMESMNSLCRKYAIETCTLASEDGLVIASSFPGGTRDAAYFSNLYFQDKKTRKGDITISPMRYKDQDLVVIIRSQRNLDSEDIEAIKSDEKRILLYWL